jgi:hypothetical protein
MDRPRLRWQDDTEVDVNEIECNDVKWISVNQDIICWCSSVNAAMAVHVPKKMSNYLNN